MSVLNGAQAYFIGFGSGDCNELQSALEELGTDIAYHDASDAIVTQIETNAPEYAVFNLISGTGAVRAVFQAVRAKIDPSRTALFAFIDEKFDIQQVLQLGFSDYLKQHEPVADMVNKIQIALGDTVNSAGSTVLHITERPPTMKSDDVRVLVVEDDPLLANLLTTKFDRASIPCHLNKTGKNVPNDIDAFKPNFVILDLMLPGVSGFDILKELRAHEKYSDLPVIIFSNRDSIADKKRAAKLGATAFRVKAMTDLSALLEEIVTLVQARSS